MKNCSVVTASSMWGTQKLIKKTEDLINEKTREGFTVVSVSFSYDTWNVPTAFITLSREN
jgi:hypothetical protein